MLQTVKAMRELFSTKKEEGADHHLTIFTAIFPEDPKRIFIGASEVQSQEEDNEVRISLGSSCLHVVGNVSLHVSDTSNIVDHFFLTFSFNTKFAATKCYVPL